MKRKTKIIATIGPASQSSEMIEKLINAGVSTFRLNFSHENHEGHLQRINTIREVSKRMNKNIAILIDTKGPEIRTGEFENGKVSFEKGDIVKVVKENVVGNKERFHISCPELFDDVKPNDYILIDDGKMKLTILEVNEEGMVCRVENNGVLKTRKGCNVPNVKLSMPFISPKDDADIRFAARNNADVIAASFVRRADDILEIRKILEEEGNPNIEIIAKIENQEGYDNLEDILKVANGVMVARGDLGVEVSLQLVPIYQKNIIAKANEMGKPVVTATHMLESMTNNPRPTRAEASDVANAVLDGSDAIMCSGETAAGDYPVEAIQTMDYIATAIESTIFPYKERLEKAIASSQKSNNDAIGMAVAQAALNLGNVSAIIAFTETGGTARRICKFRPCVPIIAATNSLDTCRRLAYYNGVYPVYDENITDVLKYDETASRVAKSLGIPSGSTVIITAGWRTGHGNTNTMRIVEVE